MVRKVKRTAKLLLQVIIAIILGTVLMIAVYSLPVDVMREHVQESNIIQFRENGYILLGSVDCKF